METLGGTVMAQVTGPLYSMKRAGLTPQLLALSSTQSHHCGICGVNQWVKVLSPTLSQMENSKLRLALSSLFLTLVTAGEGIYSVLLSPAYITMQCLSLELTLFANSDQLAVANYGMEKDSQNLSGLDGILR